MNAHLAQRLEHGFGNGSAGRAKDGRFHTQPFPKNREPLLDALSQIR
jgi:hypothetical protein